jgi:peptidylprolyl isomerase
MHHAQPGDRVRIRYVRFASNSQTNSPQQGEKIREFTVGGTEVLSALSHGVVGMSPGDHRQITIAPGEAYGKIQRKLIRTIPRARFPEQLELRVGKRLRARHTKSGRPALVTVMEVRPDSVLVNGNHPLAGQSVTFDVNLLSLDTSSTANLSKPQKDVGGEH